jgi:hypothetical protein
LTNCPKQYAAGVGGSGVFYVRIGFDDFGDTHIFQRLFQQPRNLHVSVTFLAHLNEKVLTRAANEAALVETLLG